MSEQEQKQAEAEKNAENQTDSDAVAAASDAVEDAGEASQATENEELSLEDTIAKLSEDLATAQDAALRAQADAQNVKRRSEQDVERARKFALERFAGDLLPVVDNLERALELMDGADDAVKSLAEGVELTRKSLLDTLKKHQVEAVDPTGEPFDPQLHQAMSMVENPDVEPNTIIAVMQKGYTLNGRLVRPAMVMVSKAAS